MTDVTQIITDAFRQSNLVATGVAPTSAEQTEALRYLNRIVLSVFGNEAGEQLVPFPIGANGFSRPSGYPWWGNTPDSGWFVPKNTRVMLNLTAPVSLYLHPAPDDGSRFAYIDVSGNLATHNVTLYGNGNLIGASPSVTVSTDSASAEYFYRADQGRWVQYAPLGLTDTFPFPEEFDDYFITMLAVRFNPSYGASIDGQSQMIFERSKKQLRARYSQYRPTQSEAALLRLSNMTADRDRTGNVYGLYDASAMFNKGWPF